MAYRLRGKGHFTTGETRSGKSFVYTGRRVQIKNKDFQLNWDGPIVIAELLGAVENALTELSDNALSYMQGIVAHDTGYLEESCFVRVVNNNGKLSVIIGAEAYYAIYVELGTRFASAQPFIRPTFDYLVKNLRSMITSEVVSRATNR